MANWLEPTPAQESAWDEWVAARSPVARDICRKLKPWTLYRMKDTGQRCTFYSCEEDGTITVNVTGRFNLMLYGRRVFGVDPETLEECSLPGPDEPLGEFLAPDQAPLRLPSIDHCESPPSRSSRLRCLPSGRPRR